MIKKSKPWDRPLCCGTPNRTGDKDPTPIYTALGRAVSAWEGVNAALSGLYAELDKGQNVQIFAFGDIPNVHKRAKTLRNECERFLNGNFTTRRNDAAKLKKLTNLILRDYVGWSARRNDLAHGYVTMAQCPDYSDVKQPIITVYALVPSHARLSKYNNAEPIFNYVADDINFFAKRFSELDERIEKASLIAAEIFEFRS
jgi:hypothetical protein